MSKKYRINCVQSTCVSIVDMINQEKTITRATFCKHTDKEDREQLEKSLGYAIGKEEGLRMKDDQHVSYHKSEYEGEQCVYFAHSAIEYIFI